MAEAIAAGASVIAILQITDRIIALCKFYVGTAQDAPADIRVIFLEILSLTSVLESFEFLVACNSEVSVAVRNLAGRNGPIEGCRRAVAELEKLFPSDCIYRLPQTKHKSRKADVLLAALAWPLKAKKAKELLDEMSRYKETISLALITENA